MKYSDRYHQWIEWSEEDQTYIGKCPDLMTGIHGDDPVRLYDELREVVEDVIRHLTVTGCLLPVPRVRPVREVEDSSYRARRTGEECHKKIQKKGGRG